MKIEETTDGIVTEGRQLVVIDDGVISAYGCKERYKHSCKNKEHKGT